jgi:hypothetical protein
VQELKRRKKKINGILQKASSPLGGEIWVENVDFRGFQSPFRDAMWVS